MKAGSNLEKVLAAGHFAVTAECGPPRGADPEIVRKKAAYVKGNVDACNVTDNQTSVVRMSSVAGCMRSRRTIRPFSIFTATVRLSAIMTR